MTSLKWIFDPLPPSGAIQGGIPIAHVLGPDMGIDTFVREVLQNSLDQATGNEIVRVNFGFHEMDDAKRRQNGLAANAIAVEIVHIAGGKDDSKAGRRAGLMKGDIIVAVDGRTTGMKVSDVLAYMLQKKGPGQKVALTIRRRGKPQQVMLTLP